MLCPYLSDCDTYAALTFGTSADFPIPSGNPMIEPTIKRSDIGHSPSI
ncbi:hypothetical protein [Leptolyngbya ohadii]|nr:hypothetical protein [Leptolyngbya ohadii]